MLPERAFQPRNGRYGMTLEGGGGGIVGDIVGGAVDIVGDVVGGAADIVGDVVGGAVDIVKDVGSGINDFVKEEVPGGWATVGLAAGGAALASGAGGAAAAAPAGGAAGGTGLTVGAGGITGITPGAAGVTGITAGSSTALGGTLGAGLGTLASGGMDGALGTGLDPSTSGMGFTAGGSGAPELASMGGGSGLLAPVQGGVVGELGLTATGAVPVLGSPGSFINDPAVLGQPVINPATSSISLNDAFRAARLAGNLMGNEQPQQQFPMQQLPGMQAGAVDLLSLPQLRATRAEIAGLLAPRAYRGPVFDIYSGLPTSLLG
jgi:hypothetical protein